MTNNKTVVLFHLNSYSIFNPDNPFASFGGSEVDIYNISVFLKQKGYNVKVIVGDFGQNDVEYINGVELIKSIQIKNRGWLFGVINMFVILYYLFKSNGDIYIFKCASHYLGLGVLFGKIFRRKIIYRTAHDVDCNGDFIRDNGFLGLIYKYGLLNSDYIITQNIENKIMLLNNYGIDSIVINNIYDVNINDVNGFNKRDYILWCSRCEKWKNPGLFLDLVERNPNYMFIMISPSQVGLENFYDEIKLRASKYKNLKFIEKVNFREIQDYYNNALFFVGTSDYDGFPNTYIQSCLGGTPIISFKVNPSEFITKYKLGIFCNGNFSDFFNSLIALNEKLNWEVMSENTIKYVYKNHGYNVEGKKYINLLNSLLN